MPKNNQTKIIVIIGPTASGKSDLGIKLALRLSSGQAKKLYDISGAEIISADSRQVYKGMDIGTGKVARDATLHVPNAKFKNPTPFGRGLLNKIEWQNGKLKSKNFYSGGIRHHLIDVANPKKQFTVNDFKRLGEKAIKEITAKDKIPIIIGGTGFYIDILLDRITTAEVPPNKKMRAKLEKQSAEHLFRILSVIDPNYSKIIDRHNKRRLIRAIEIVKTTGKPMLKIATDNKYEILWLGIYPEKEKLVQNIKKRLDARLKQGMIEEVENLHNLPTGGGLSWKRLDDLGLEYRWISRYLRNRISEEEMKNNLLRDIIKYSKRQMVWFKKNKEIRWIMNRKEAEKLLSFFLRS